MNFIETYVYWLLLWLMLFIHLNIVYLNSDQCCSYMFIFYMSLTYGVFFQSRFTLHAELLVTFDCDCVKRNAILIIS